jgi:hypothetical protein
MTDPNFLNTMYQSDDEPVAETSPIDPAGFNHSRKIRVGIIEYEVPTLEYVARLEQLIARQQGTIDRLNRSVARFHAMLLATRNATRHQAAAINEMATELTTKVTLYE